MEVGSDDAIEVEDAFAAANGRLDSDDEEEDEDLEGGSDDELADAELGDEDMDGGSEDSEESG